MFGPADLYRHHKEADIDGEDYNDRSYESPDEVSFRIQKAYIKMQDIKINP